MIALALPDQTGPLTLSCTWALSFMYVFHVFHVGILGLHVSIIPGAIPRIHVLITDGWDSTVNWFNWTCYPKNMLNQLNQFPTATSTPGITGLTFLRIASPRVGKVPPCRLPTRGVSLHGGTIPTRVSTWSSRLILNGVTGTQPRTNWSANFLLEEYQLLPGNPSLPLHVLRRGYTRYSSWVLLE